MGKYGVHNMISVRFLISGRHLRTTWLCKDAFQEQLGWMLFLSIEKAPADLITG